MASILEKLAGGDRRSIGRSNEVVADVLADPSLFGALFEGMVSDDPLVRMRAADAVEKITASHPEYLAPHKKRLIQKVARIDQQEVRWHVCQLVPRLTLTRAERRAVANIVTGYLNETSRIVKTFAMQALADLGHQDAGLRAPIIARLEELTRTGSPAMASRGRRLLAQLRK